jgi:6-phosphogluconolactonase
MAGAAWLDHVLIPKTQIHPIPAELGAIAAANLYIKTLGAVDSFDLVLLGLGEDGHTASLFPGRDWGIEADSPDVLSVYDAPKPPPERVSLSAKRLARASRVIFLVSGIGKMAAVRAWRGGSVSPATAVAPIGSVDVFVDFPLTDF